MYYFTCQFITFYITLELKTQTCSIQVQKHFFLTQMVMLIIYFAINNFVFNYKNAQSGLRIMCPRQFLGETVSGLRLLVN